MKNFLQYLLFFTPSFLNKAIRRLAGQKIGKRVRIKMGTLLSMSDVEIGDYVKIGPLAVIKGSTIRIGDFSKIQPLCIVSSYSIALHKHTHIAPTAVISGGQSKSATFVLGDHSRIFPFCWIDTGHGVEIGKHVGIGGHTLIFTHGSWPNYLEGGIVSFGKVIIEDEVWIPWRVFILPNTVIGKNSVVGGNSLLNAVYPPHSLIAGSPAKILREGIGKTIDADEKQRRFTEIFTSYFDYKGIQKPTTFFEPFSVKDMRISIDQEDDLTKGSLLILLNKAMNISEIHRLNSQGVHVIDHTTNTLHKASKSKLVDDIVFYLRKYGVRLYIQKK